MAKDGTNRGGRRVRAGDKPMSAAEKIQKGQALSGDIDGAQKGLNSLLRRCAYEHNNRNAACSR